MYSAVFSCVSKLLKTVGPLYLYLNVYLHDVKFLTEASIWGVCGEICCNVKSLIVTSHSSSDKWQILKWLETHAIDKQPCALFCIRPCNMIDSAVMDIPENSLPLTMDALTILCIPVWRYPDCYCHITELTATPVAPDLICAISRRPFMLLSCQPGWPHVNLNLLTFHH